MQNTFFLNSSYWCFTERHTANDHSSIEGLKIGLKMELYGGIGHGSRKWYFLALLVVFFLLYKSSAGFILSFWPVSPAAEKYQQPKCPVVKMPNKNTIYSILNNLILFQLKHKLQLCKVWFCLCCPYWDDTLRAVL